MISPSSTSTLKGCETRSVEICVIPSRPRFVTLTVVIEGGGGGGTPPLTQATHKHMAYMHAQTHAHYILLERDCEVLYYGIKAIFIESYLMDEN